MADETPQSARRAELAAFLRAQRARLRPVDVGLLEDCDSGRRRTPGLRREEIAPEHARPRRARQQSAFPAHILSGRHVYLLTKESPTWQEADHGSHDRRGH